MDLATLRKQLLANITKMCDYAEKELHGVSGDFSYKFDQGFLYGHNCDYIQFFYSATTHKAQVIVCHYSTSLHFYSNRVIRNTVFTDGEDCTENYLTNFRWYLTKEMQEAMTITQQNWVTIKSKIAQHKEKEASIMSFEI